MISWNANGCVRTVGSWSFHDGIRNISGMSPDDLRECIAQMSPEDRARLGVSVPTIDQCVAASRLAAENQGQRATIERQRRELEFANEQIFMLKPELKAAEDKLKLEFQDHARTNNRLSETQRSLEASRAVVERFEKELAEAKGRHPCEPCTLKTVEANRKLAAAEKRIAELGGKATVLPDWLAACPEELVEELKWAVAFVSSFIVGESPGFAIAAAMRAMANAVQDSGCEDRPGAARQAQCAAMRCLSAAASLRRQGTEK